MKQEPSTAGILAMLKQRHNLAWEELISTSAALKALEATANKFHDINVLVPREVWDQLKHHENEHSVACARWKEARIAMEEATDLVRRKKK